MINNLFGKWPKTKTLGKNFAVKFAIFEHFVPYLLKSEERSKDFFQESFKLSSKMKGETSGKMFEL